MKMEKFALLSDLALLGMEKLVTYWIASHFNEHKPEDDQGVLW